METAFIYTALFCISLVYNAIVGHLEKKNKLGGIKALLVYGGVTYTLTLSAFLVGRDAALLVGGAFFFALIPMVAGEVIRHLKEDDEFAKFWEERAREFRQKLGRGQENE
jgi:hypothetical protein